MIFSDATEELPDDLGEFVSIGDVSYIRAKDHTGHMDI